MRELRIQLRSVQDVLAFVALATSRTFPVRVGNAVHQVNGKSFMEMFCLDFRAPVTVRMDCTREEFEAFRADAARFEVKGK